MLKARFNESHPSACLDLVSLCVRARRLVSCGPTSETSTSLGSQAGGHAEHDVVHGRMPIDGGLIVGYLTAALLRAGRRWADRTMDSLLNRLTDLVASRMGHGPLDRLAGNPGDEGVQREVGLTIDGALTVDRGFARELAEVVAELDRRGGRQIVNQVYAQMNVQAFDHGVAIGRDFNYFHAPDPSDYSDAPSWVKFCVVLGSALAAAGVFIFGYTLFTGIPDVNDPGFGETPPGIPLAFGVFFIGFLILGIGAIGRAMSKRR